MKMSNNYGEYINKKTENKTQKTIKKIFMNNKTFIASLFIIIVSFLSSIPMFNPDFNMQFDDGIQHICRLIGTEQSIKEGQLIPVIMSNLCNGFGYSWNLFYSPVTSYLPLIFRIFTTSYEMCLKLFMFVVSIASGFAMYFFVKKFLKGHEKNIKHQESNKDKTKGPDKKGELNQKLDDNKIELIAVLAGVFYILLPYRLNDMYLRLAVSELTSFIFLPIVFNGLYSIVNLKEKSYLLVLGGVGMLLTHSLLTVYLVIFCVIYLLINIKKIDKKTFLTLLTNAGIILLLSAFYWLPLLQTKLSTDYEVFNDEHMIRWDAMIALKAKPAEIAFYVPGRMFYGIGILVIIGTALSFTILKQKDIDRKNFVFFLICGLVSSIMALNFFPFEKLPSLFTMMQFSFRMLEFGGFFLVICASIAIGLSIKKFNIYTVLGFTCIALVLLFPNLCELHYGRYYTEEELIKGIPITSDTGRVHAGCASFEYLPNNALENREYIENRENVPIILEDENGDSRNDTGLATIENFNKDGTSCSFNVVTKEGNDELDLSSQNESPQINDSNEIEDSLKIELPYIYYIGYNVEYTDDSGNNYSVETYESENGFLCIDVPNENITVNVKYTGTVLMKIAYIISAVTVLVLIIIYFIKRVKERK